jgi:hypothetical protein
MTPTASALSAPDADISPPLTGARGALIMLPPHHPFSGRSGRRPNAQLVPGQWNQNVENILEHDLWGHLARLRVCCQFRVHSAETPDHQREWVAEVSPRSVPRAPVRVHAATLFAALEKALEAAQISGWPGVEPAAYYRSPALWQRWKSARRAPPTRDAEGHEEREN